LSGRAGIDLTPLIPAGRQLIERYAASGFRVSGVVHPGPVLVFPDQTVAWAVADIGHIHWEELQPVIDHGGVQILLFGQGLRMTPVPAGLRARLRGVGVVLEAMDTGAACRTYNVLLAEDRPVAAALLPPR
jgi:uncharacterized protein